MINHASRLHEVTQLFVMTSYKEGWPVVFVVVLDLCLLLVFGLSYVV